MNLTSILLSFVLVVVTMLIGAGTLVLLVRHPEWSVPAAGAMAAMMLMISAVGLLAAVTPP
ncbi:hypothetical protein ACFXOI_19600 [Streptomyces bacillaris]|uniref:hypothetical protein n=1 Tax=Streptomyces bacillaris TaxID=68179 RepID=UPI003684F6E8